MQTAAEHTPGPWTFEPESDGSYYIGAQQGPLSVCPARAHSKPDARLIAAAPDLLEALKAMFKVYGNTCSSTLASQVAAALSKVGA